MILVLNFWGPQKALRQITPVSPPLNRKSEHIQKFGTFSSQEPLIKSNHFHCKDKEMKAQGDKVAHHTTQCFLAKTT